MEEIRISDVSFAYPGRDRNALCDVSFSVNSGDFITLCGKSGCGKTTLLRLMKPSVAPVGELSGQISVDGRNITELTERLECEKIGFVMQSPENQIVTDKVWHELAFGLESLGVRNEEIRARVAETAAFFGIDSWFHKKTAELSGGQKQLLCLASVMVMNPSIIILDEPTSQLDPISAGEFLRTLKRLNTELGITVILSEQRLEEALPLSDRVIVLDDGEVVADGTVDEISCTLNELNHPICRALPAPVRVHAVLDGKTSCPITVSDGRGWLTDFSKTHSFSSEFICEENPSGQDGIPAIEAREVYFGYSRECPDIVKNLHFKAYPGQVSAIVGGNGAGKSTALSVMSGLLSSQRGKVLVFGQKLSGCKDLYGGMLGYMPQDVQTLFAEKTVYHELFSLLPEKNMPEAEKREKIKTVLSLCSLSGLENSHPYDLSGGEQQRLALAMLLLRNPRILLLDEPTKGMDASFKDVFGALLRTLKSRGVTIVMVSHDVEFCAEYADVCSLFFDGAIVSHAPAREFFSGKSFYTTSANRMARTLIPEAVTAEDIITAFGGNVPQKPDVDVEYPPEDAGDLKVEKDNGLTPPKLSKRLGMSMLFSLVAIVASVYAGVFVFESRRYYFLSLLIILEAMVPFCISFERRKPRARELITVSVLCAIAVVGRAAFFMVPQFKPVAAIVIIAGVAFGGECGFLVGALSGFASNFFFGQGPWAPWQMLAFGAIGLLAGVLSSMRILKNNRTLLSVFGFAATFIIYGGLLNPASVIMWQHNPTLEMLLSSYVVGLPFDMIHAASTAIFLWFISRPMLEKLERIKIKYNVLR
ncbi:MAG: ATP-binding cassette domain-containing protein [Oscillospiraceae bacterium]|nr:ATP-binding cassette domain-containing protein [Oscillospiraceae bacterium]